MYLLLAVLLATPQQSPNLLSDARLDRHITFRSSAAPAKSVIGEFGKTAELPIQASGTIQSDVLLVSVKDVPVRDVMVHLQNATGGTWLVDAGTYYLARTDADIRRAKSAVQTRLANAIKAALSDEIKSMSKSPSFDSTAAQGVLSRILTPTADAGPSTTETPMARLAARVVQLVDVKRLALAPPRRRTVFSTNPTRMEYSLQADLGSAISQFEAEEAILRQAAAALPEKRRRHVIGNTQLFPSLPAGIAKVNVVVNRSDRSPDAASLAVQLIAPNGNCACTYEVQVHTDPDFPDEKALQGDPREPKLSIPPDDVIAMQVLGASIGGKSARVTTLPERLRNQIANPVRFEPLGGFTSSLLLTASDARHVNLVADVPDSYMMLGAIPTISGLPSASSVLKFAGALPSTMAPIKSEAGWLEIDGGQSRPEEVLCHRSDRQALADLFANALDGSLPIESLAKYAYSGGGVPDDFMYMVMQELLLPSGDKAGAEQWRALRVLGALLNRRPGTTLQPGVIPFANLNAATISEVESLVFFQDIGSLDSAAADSSDSPDIDPCDQFPSGLPSDGALEIRVESTAIVFDVSAHHEPIDAETLAYSQALKEHPDRRPDDVAQFSTTDLFMLGTERKVTLTFHLSKDVSRSASVVDTRVRAGTECSFADLPASFREEYRVAKAKADAGEGAGK